MSLPAFLDPTLLAQVGDLARAIAGADADAHRLEIALRIAAAHIDVVRVRQVRCDLFSAAPFDCATLVRSAALERYERRALSRRKFAMNSMPRAGLHHEWAPSILAKRTHGVKVGGRRFGQTNPRSTAVDCNGTSN